LGYFGTAPGGELSTADGPRPFQLRNPRPPQAGPARALALPVARAVPALTMALALARSMARDSAAVDSEAPERAVTRTRVLGQDGPPMKAEPLLPPGSW